MQRTLILTVMRAKPTDPYEILGDVPLPYAERKFPGYEIRKARCRMEMDEDTFIEHSECTKLEVIE